MNTMPSPAPRFCCTDLTLRSARASVSATLFLLLVLSCALSLVTGCGTGGYAGGGIGKLSASALTLDAGQSYPITATLATGSPAASSLNWTLSGASCSGASCGTLSSTTGATVTYIAPAGITTALQVSLVASIPGTTSSSTVTVTVNPDPILSGTPPGGVVGQPYTTSITASRGTAPLTVSVIAGTPPAGLTYNAATGVLSGTPTTAGTSSFTVQVVDSSIVPFTVSAVETVSVFQALVLNGVTPAGIVGVPYAGALSASGGAGAPYTFAIAAGTLPTGLVLSSSGSITGTPSAAGTFAFTGQVTDAAGNRSTAIFSINVGAAVSLKPGNPPTGTVGVPYTGPIPVTGGTGPYTCTLTGGTLPAGLTLGPNCTLVGTPTAPGSGTITVGVSDSGNPPNTGSGTVTVTINPAALSLTTGTLPNGTVGTPYSSTIGVAGGTAPYTCSLVSGTLQAGLTLNANCSVTGTPTVAGSTILTVKATDSGNPTQTITGPVSLTINPAGTLTVGNPPAGTVGTPYTGPIPITGGTGPYTCTLTGGTLPAGLTLGPNCTITGTPTTPGSGPITIGIGDSGKPPTTGGGTIIITINPAALTLTTGTLPNGTVGTPYSSTIGVAGGTAPYTCSLVSGTLQAGLTFNANCSVTGTPTVAGSTTLTVKATDSSNPANSTTGPVALTINPAALTLTTGTLPNGTVGTPYSSTIGVAGGTAPYTCSLVSGTLQAGLTLNANCSVTGTPTVAGSTTLTVKATDSGNPTQTITGPVSLTINPAPVLVISNPPNGTVGTPYSGPIPVAGGTGPYTCTLNAGTLPAGLTLGANCTVTGTPTTPGPSTITVGVTDSGQPPTTTSGAVTITINPAPVSLTLGNPPAGTVGTPYTGTIPVAGGTAPYTCSLASGAVPAGLTFNANCTLTGTPTASGTSLLTVTTTDSSNPANTSTGPVSVVINPVPALTFTGSLPNGIVNQPYSQTLAASGGIGPYTYTTTAGALPPGLTLGTNGAITGTPTAVGAYSFTATATDSETTPQTASLPLVILVTYAPGVNNGLLNGPYAFLFQGYDDVVLGLFAYQTATAGSFFADGAGALSAGELDSNHQTSNPTGNTITSNAFLGTYYIGADYRGLLTITTLNASGTVAGTSTYAIAVKPALAPATTSAQASMIEFDNDQLAGTRGSGTILQQTASAFANGLTGSYAFGVQGDTPCLPTCAINLVPGPVAEVGQFAVNAGTLTGMGDANIAANRYTSQALTGSYGVADSNGRVQMALTTAGTPAPYYPTDYAVYMVNANQLFLVSTDKHSANILLAGTAQSQTLAAFSNSSLSGPFVGYENAPTNPGLVGTTLNNTLNFSTATVFRAVGDSAGNCNTTNVTQGGTTALLNNLTGLGGSLPILQGLLGAYAATGTAPCLPAPDGRVVFNYPSALPILGLGPAPPPARILYLAGVNRGYFLESGFAGLGQIEPQTGQPYTQGSFNGTYVYQQVPASSAATTNTDGVLVANGQGSATATQDLNVGVGTINVLQLGVTSTYPYTTPDTTTGIFQLNGTIYLYEISPGRFALIDTSALLTSPSVYLLD